MVYNFSVAFVILNVIAYIYLMIYKEKSRYEFLLTYALNLILFFIVISFKQFDFSFLLIFINTKNEKTKNTVMQFLLNKKK